MNLHVNVEKEGNQSLVKLSGETDVYTVSILEEKVLPLVDTEEKVQVDLHKVTYMDSTGLGVFISAYKKAQENNCHFEIVHAHDRVLRLFIVTGLDEIINLRTESGGEQA